MKIIVCMKQVMDPEVPASLFKVNEETKQIVPSQGVPPVISPFDENALEVALKIKETNEARITAISLGKNIAKPVLSKSLAAGADELILLDDDRFDNLDSHVTASVLAAAIKKLGEYDIILCGREASDTNAGQVGSGIAEMLNIPCITLARKIECAEEKLIIERITSDGYDTLQVPFPVLVTVSNEVGSLRYASLPAIMAAKKKPRTVWKSENLGIESLESKKIEMVKLYQPVRENRSEIIEGENPEEAAAKLALKLREVNII